jgi:hypothetical protein
MTSKQGLLSRRVAAAALAVALTIGVHGGWLRGLDHDAVAVIGHAAA